MRYLLPIDELNAHRAAHEAYFRPMRLSDEEKRRRAELAEELELLFLLMFWMMESELLTGDAIDEDYYTDWLARRYRDAARKYSDISRGFVTDIEDKSSEIVKSTLRQIEREKDADGRVPDSARALSGDRALSMARDEANYVRNRGMLDEADRQGFRWKIWRTMNDSRVRESHANEEGATIPIDDYFNINGSLMRYPMDLSMDPSLREVLGCRCSLEFAM